MNGLGEDLGYCLICDMCMKVKKVKDLDGSLICEDCRKMLKDMVDVLVEYHS